MRFKTLCINETYDVKLMQNVETGEIRLCDSNGWFKGKDINVLPSSQVIPLFPEWEHMLNNEDYHV